MPIDFAQVSCLLDRAVTACLLWAFIAVQLMQSHRFVYAIHKLAGALPFSA